MSQPVLHVQMLGGFSLQLGPDQVGPLPSRSATSLLAFLIVHRDRPQTRDLLAGRFWSDLAEDRARRRLSNALWQIRSAGRSAGDVDLLASTPSTVQIDPAFEVEVDAEVFERRLDEIEQKYRDGRSRAVVAELASLVESYRGELLSGHYDEWIDDQRSKVRDRYHSALSQLVQLSTGSADYETALRHARALVAADPLREEWHRDVMRLCALNGQPTAADRQYDDCAAVLRNELGAEPSPETTDLIERIRKDAAAPPAPLPSSGNEPPPLVGRSAERAALLGRVNELVGGKGGVVLIEGDPGIGKTKLVAEIAKGAEWRGVQVLAGSHSAASALTPYGGLREALAPVTTGLRGERLVASLATIWLRHASTVLDGLRVLVEPDQGQALRPQEEPWRTTEALAQVILAQSSPKPTILILEDVHWCDDDTVAVLVQLGDRLIDSRVLVCLTYQRHEAQRSPTIWLGISELEAKPGSTRHVIPPLDPGEVRQLVVSELGPGRMTDQALSRLASTTGGNPYMVLELLRGQVDSFDEAAFDLPESPPTGSADRQAMPQLAGILTRRVESAPDDVQQVLRGVAVMTGPAATGVVARAVGLDQHRVVAAMAEAVDLGFLVETDRGCEFDHDQTRRAVYESIDPETRATFHGRVVYALVGVAGVGVEELAHHAWLAGNWPLAYQYHSLAGDAALNVNAHQTAAEHLAKADQAAVAADIGDEQRVEDLLAYEHVLEILGERDEQQRLLKRLSDLAGLDSGAELEMRQRQAWLLAHTDRGLEAAQLASAAIEPARQAGHGIGELLTIIGCARNWSGDFAGAIDPLQRAVAELEAAGESALSALLMLGRTHHDLGDLEAAQHHMEAAHLRAKAGNDARNQVEALADLAMLYHTQGKESEAEEAFLDGLRLASEIGYRHGEGRNMVNLAVFYALQGRGGKALGLFTGAGEVFASLRNGRGEAFVKVNAAELAHLILGDDVMARSQAGAAAVHFRRIGDERHEASCLVILASIDRRVGKRRLARRRLRVARGKARSSNDPLTEAVALMNLALVELDLGRHENALAGTEAALAIDSEQVTPVTPVLQAIEARALAGLGRVDGARERLNRSIAGNKPGSGRAHLAAWWNAEVLAEIGDGSAAAEQVALAHQLLVRNLDGLPDLAARRAWDVPEHRAIADARERYFVDQVSWRVPGREAPTGRPLDSEELIDIVWTISHPDDWAVPASAARRRLRIQRLATEAWDQGGVARVADVAAALDVSERTIKRDLAQLRADGYSPPTRRGPGES